MASAAGRPAALRAHSSYFSAARCRNSRAPGRSLAHRPGPGRRKSSGGKSCILAASASAPMRMCSMASMSGETCHRHGEQGRGEEMRRGRGD
eukprot:343401-Chlamydomonas_euryale.AAC.1